MAYPTDSIDINRSTTGLVLTPEQSNEIFAKAIEQSAVMRLAERVTLPGSGLSIPVITGEPVADFVAETAEKPVSNATFSAKTMTPYKIAVIEMFSMEFRRDFRRLYDELVRRLPAALSTKFDATVFHGSAPGTGFDVLTNATAEDIATDPYAGLVAAYSDIATENYRPTGFALSPAAEVLLYAATDKEGRPLFLPSIADGSVGAILGAPVVKTSHVYKSGNPDVIGFVGDWSQAKYGIVDGINLAITDQATINDGTNQINLWQRNMFAVRAEFEVGFVCANTDAFVKLTNSAVASA